MDHLIPLCCLSSPSSLINCAAGLLLSSSWLSRSFACYSIISSLFPSTHVHRSDVHSIMGSAAWTSSCSAFFSPECSRNLVIVHLPSSLFPYRQIISYSIFGGLFMLSCQNRVACTSHSFSSLMINTCTIWFLTSKYLVSGTHYCSFQSVKQKILILQYSFSKKKNHK